MDRLRKVPFLIALAVMAIVVGIEVGSSFLDVPPPDRDTLASLIFEERVSRESPPPDPETRQILRADARAQADETLATWEESPRRPGMGIPYLALVDGLLLFTVLMMGLSLIVPERIWGRLHGVVRLIAMVLLIIASILMITVAFILMMVMFGLFVATPFGTIAYLAVWGFFDRGGAQVTLSLLLTLKVAFGVLLFLAQQRFALHKGLVALVLTSLLANAVVSLLHGLVPSVMVSITDALAAVVVGVLAAIWAVVMAVGAVIAVLSSIRLGKQSA